MSKYGPKTKVNDQNIIEFLEKVENPTRREDSFVLLKIFEEVTGEEPKMWGDSMIGFGKYHYIDKSGIEADWLKT